MANDYFEWPDNPSRFERFDTVRSTDANNALDEVTAGFTAVQADIENLAEQQDPEAMRGESADSLAISTGVKAFTMTVGLAFNVGQYVNMASEADANNVMGGRLTAYDRITGVSSVTVTDIGAGATGTHADWIISLGVDPSLSGNATGGINELKGPDIASAADMSGVWAVAQGNTMGVTGTTPTTSFGTAPQAGAKRTLLPAAAWPITAGANLVINGVTSGNTYTCAAGDTVELVAKTTTLMLVNITKLDGTAVVSSGSKAFVVRHEEPNGTNGGAFNTTGAWVQLTINATQANNIAGASLGSNLSTLPAGDYTVEVVVPIGGIGAARLRLRNTTDAATLVEGSNGVGNSTGYMLHLSGAFTLSGAKTISLDLWCDTGSPSVSALGSAVSTGGVEIFAVIKFTKVA